MVETTSRVERVVHELRPRRVEVRAIEDIAPNYRRITFGGDDLATFVSAAPADHVKLLISLDPERAPVPPVRGEKGMRPAEGAPPQAMRDFTPRRFDAERAELQMDFVIHETGVASDWARAAQPGTPALILGPRGSKVVRPLFDWFLMIGDETMLPAIARQIEELPTGMKLVAFVEVDDPASEQAIESAGDVELHWVHRNGEAPGAGTALLDAVKAATFPEGEFFTWAGGEAGQLRAIRRHLIDERGVQKEFASITGHWKRGEADFDHHAPLDTDA
jgi:NADPH-dependent ferric siderophore reductase